MFLIGSFKYELDNYVARVETGTSQVGLSGRIGSKSYHFNTHYQAELLTNRRSEMPWVNQGYRGLIVRNVEVFIRRTRLDVT